MAATTCSKALESYLEKKGDNASTVKKVLLYGQLPPIDKMDMSLNTLQACEHLSLSTNNIDKMISLPDLSNIKILSLSRNIIKKISGLEPLSNTLRELWLSYNQIATLDGLSGLDNLEVLQISNNKIASWSEVKKLRSLPKLTSVGLTGNPIYDSLNRYNAHVEVIVNLPFLSKVDGRLVTDEVRNDASEKNTEA